MEGSEFQNQKPSQYPPQSQQYGSQYQNYQMLYYLQQQQPQYNQQQMGHHQYQQYMQQQQQPQPPPQSGTSPSQQQMYYMTPQMQMHLQKQHQYQQQMQQWQQYGQNSQYQQHPYQPQQRPPMYPMQIPRMYYPSADEKQPIDQQVKQEQLASQQPIYSPPMNQIPPGYQYPYSIPPTDKPGFLMPKTKENVQQSQTPIQMKVPQEVMKNVIITNIEDVPTPKPEIATISKEEMKENMQQFFYVDVCHYCGGTKKLCYHCYDNYEGTTCKSGYCFDCLLFKFKENIVKQIVSTGSWKCPFLEGKCDCSKCTSKQESESDPCSINSESSSKYSRMLDNLKKIKKRQQRRRNIVKEVFSTKFQNLDQRIKKKQINQQIQKVKQHNKNRIRKQLNFTGESILRLKRAQTAQDRLFIHKIIQYNLDQLIQQQAEQEG